MQSYHFPRTLGDLHLCPRLDGSLFSECTSPKQTDVGVQTGRQTVQRGSFLEQVERLPQGYCWKGFRIAIGNLSSGGEQRRLTFGIEVMLSIGARVKVIERSVLGELLTLVWTVYIVNDRIGSPTF